MRTFRQHHKSLRGSSVSDTLLSTSRKTILSHTRWCKTSLIAPLEVDGLFMHIVCFQCIVLHLSSYLWKEHGYWYSWLFGRHWAIYLMNHSQMLGLINTLLSGHVQLSCKFLFFFPFNFSTCHKFEGPRCYLELVFLGHNTCIIYGMNSTSFLQKTSEGYNEFFCSFFLFCRVTTWIFSIPWYANLLL